MTTELDETVVFEGKDVKKHAKGPRRWNGTRVTFRSVDSSTASKLVKQKELSHKTVLAENVPSGKTTNPFVSEIQRILNSGEEVSQQDK